MRSPGHAEPAAPRHEGPRSPRALVRISRAVRRTEPTPDHPRSRNGYRRRRAPGSGSQTAPAACGAGCRSGTRAGSSRCRSLGGTAAAGGIARLLPAPLARRAGVEIVGVSRQSNRPSRSLTLSAPNTRISALTPAARSAAPSSMSAHARRSAPASSSARATWRAAMTVSVRFDDGDDPRRIGAAAPRRGTTQSRR